MNCPKCNGDCFDETKSKYWNDGKTKEGKNKPRWKCKRKGECDGVAWDNPPAAPTPVAAATPAAAPVPEMNSEKKSELYKRITTHVLSDIVPLYAKAQIPITMEGTGAIVATLYISATRT